MEELENKTRLEFALNIGASDVLAAIGALLFPIGAFGSIVAYSVYWLTRFSYATELMAGLSASWFLGLLFIFRPYRIAFDKNTSTVKHGTGIFSGSESIAFTKSVVLEPTIAGDSDHFRDWYRVYIVAKNEVDIVILHDLLAARQLARQVAFFLAVPFVDQTQDEPLNPMLNDEQSTASERRPTLTQFALKQYISKPLQFTLRSAIILMIVTSIFVGIAVKLHSHNSPFVPLIGPAGFVFLVILAHVLNRRH